jgi:hypothetical protein
MIEKRADGAAWKRAWRQRERWHPRWQRGWEKHLTKQQRKVDVAAAVKTGQRAWGVGRLRKARKRQPSPEEVAAGLRDQVAEDQFETGAMALYLSLAVDEAEDAGQHTLDSLGLQRTFAWAGARDFPGNVLAVRGSKIITGIYGNHLDSLARLVVAKCDPAEPKTIGQLTREVQAEWSALTRKQAARIARTEAAHVWETTNFNAMALNGVNYVDWLLASGPAIGVRVGPVCAECLVRAAQGPFVIDDLEEIPPVHPHCRCTLVPQHDPTWLPPPEPWVGAARPLEVFA